MIALAVVLTGTLGCAGWTWKCLWSLPRSPRDHGALDNTDPAEHRSGTLDNTVILGLVALFSLSFTSGAGLLLARLGLP
jgi:hypothetical protein